jgi:hypothetical protein
VIGRFECLIDFLRVLFLYSKIGLEIVPLSIHLPFQFGLPIILILILLIKTKVMEKKNSCLMVANPVPEE